MARRRLSLTAFDLEREHHPNDASAAVAQRAVLAAERRHLERSRISVQTGKLQEQFAERRTQLKRQRDAAAAPANPTVGQWMYLQSETSFAAFVCHRLKIDLAPLEVARWILELQALPAGEVTRMFQVCEPAARDEWEQEQRIPRKCVA